MNDRLQEGEYMYKVFDKEKLEKVTDGHTHWLAGDCDGCENMRADLRNVDLPDAFDPVRSTGFETEILFGTGSVSSGWMRSTASKRLPVRSGIQ